MDDDEMNDLFLLPACLPCNRQIGATVCCVDRYRYTVCISMVDILFLP